MADHKTDKLFERMFSEVALNLEVMGGRIFANNANTERLDRSTIELKCWYRGWRLEHRIGDDKHFPVKIDEYGKPYLDENGQEQIGWSLNDCPIILTILRTEDGWLDDNEARADREPILGRFEFGAPLHDKRPELFARIALGERNFRLLRDRLFASKRPNFEVGLTVQFPPNSVNAKMMVETVHWDGKGALPIIDARIAWAIADWDSETDADEREYNSNAQESLLKNQQLSEHSELMDAIRKLESSIAKLSLPLWVAVGTAVTAIWIAQ